MKASMKFWVMTALGLGLSGCGGGGDSGGVTGPVILVPTLEISSVQKVGATAVPNANAAAKPSLISAAFSKAGRFSFGTGVAFAAHCPDPALFATSFDVEGGKVWIKEAYAILDEVEFETEPSTDSAETGPFALDLTNNDDNVGQAISVNVPAGNYNAIKFRIKRMDDAPAPILNVTDAASFRGKLLNSSTKRRPSVYIAGTVQATAGDVCKEFVFIADHRWEVEIPFRNASSGAASVDAVLLFDLEGSFKTAMAGLGATAEGLIGEVGAGTEDNMGAQFLDGRTKDPDHGTPIAEAITAALPRNMKVFVQSSGTLDDNPKGSTLVEDNATRVSGDDNPSVSDLVETEIPGEVLLLQFAAGAPPAARLTLPWRNLQTTGCVLQ
jgi:hypothetical protein